MSTIFVLIFFASLVTLPIALIKPAIFSFLTTSRKGLGLVLGTTALASLIAAAVTAAPLSNNSQSSNSDKTTLIQQTKESSSPAAVKAAATVSATPATQSATPSVAAPKPQPTNPPPGPAPVPQPKTYVNSSGNTVQSPTVYPSAPAGATAKCVDGTYSFSQHRQGTCSHRGGVAEWL